jgi:hypothetical protein
VVCSSPVNRNHRCEYLQNLFLLLCLWQRKSGRRASPHGICGCHLKPVGLRLGQLLLLLLLACLVPHGLLHRRSK